MGWRDINMNRRKPPLRLAVVPVEQGQDPVAAVLQKAARSACAALADAPAIGSELLPFAAGYLAGIARHQALRHGIDADDGEGRLMPQLLAALAGHVPEGLADQLTKLRYERRSGPQRSHRAALRMEGASDAGYLAGHLASLCGTPGLLGISLAHLATGDIEGFLTACDAAADRLQTHQPTMALRFDREERALLREALR